MSAALQFPLVEASSKVTAASAFIMMMKTRMMMMNDDDDDDSDDTDRLQAGYEPNFPLDPPWFPPFKKTNIVLTF